MEAPGIEPGSENFSLMPLRAYPLNYIAAGCAQGQALLVAIPLFDFASHPVARWSAIQLGYALPRALEGPSVRRLSIYLFRQRERLRYRSQLGVPRGIYVVPQIHGTQQ